MSESVVCSACGASNRAKAKFCTGCARPLPGFEPSRPAALDPVMSMRPSSEAPPRTDDAIPVLPAETAAFWLKAGYWALAMIVGFTLWCLYVTTKPGAPPLKTEIMGWLAPVLNPSSGPSPTPPTSASTVPSAASDAEAPPSAPPAAASAAVPSPAVPSAAAPKADPMSPLHALLPGRAGGTAQAPPAPEERPVATSNPEPEAKTPSRSTRRSGYASRANRERIDEPSAAWTEPTPTPTPTLTPTPVPVPARRSAAPDPGPPIVAGPGPQYDYARQPSASAVPVPYSRDPVLPRQAVPDPGPPVIPGPGPRYEGARLPAEVPVAPSSDPGPPIAIGPGPLVNYSTRGAGTR